MIELKKGARITGQQRDDLAGDFGRRYEAGESVRALAASSGRSYGFVHRLLVESGHVMRARGGANRRKR